jgi:hypothetical protein
MSSISNAGLDHAFNVILEVLPDANAVDARARASLCEETVMDGWADLAEVEEVEVKAALKLVFLLGWVSGQDAAETAEQDAP